MVRARSQLRRAAAMSRFADHPAAGMCHTAWKGTWLACDSQKVMNTQRARKYEEIPRLAGSPVGNGVACN